MTRGYRYPRLLCPRCGRSVAVRLRDQRLRLHVRRYGAETWPGWCPGSELPVGDE